MVSKKLITLIPLFLLLTGCGVFGKGTTTGYIYAVDDDLFTDNLWYKSSLESSESDCYSVRNQALTEELRKIEVGTLLKLYYDRHFFTFWDCASDIVTSYEVVEQ